MLRRDCPTVSTDKNPCSSARILDVLDPDIHDGYKNKFFFHTAECCQSKFGEFINFQPLFPSLYCYSLSTHA